MSRKVGKTGLTQKDAVFEIVKSVLGNNYDPKVSVESRIAHKSDGYVKPQWHSPILNEMIYLVAQGIRDGSIPSKYNSLSSGVGEYANRITHYWITHDKRLNGNKSGTRKNLLKKRTTTIVHRLEEDPILKGLRVFQNQTETLEDELQIELYVLGQSFWIILETYGIDPRELPEHVQHALCMNHDDFMPLEKRKVA